jgi:hypothetical protein
MMRRIDARISSIEGSWTFAGCVISDSTSKAFYTKPSRISRSRICRLGFSSPHARLVPRSGRPMHRAALIPPKDSQTSRPQTQKKRRESLCCQGNGMSGQQLIASERRHDLDGPRLGKNRSLVGVNGDDATREA